MSPAVAATGSLLTAPILPTLLRFAAPNLLAMLATALAAMAETAYVGSLGVASLAAMALVFPFVMLQQMLSAGAMGGGVSSAISRALGADDGPRADALALHAVFIGVVAGVLGMALMLVLGPALYAVLGGRDAALAQAVGYSSVVFLALPAMWVMNLCASINRGAGNMRVPSATLLSAAVVQVVVGGAFGLGWFGLPRLGMAGVALGQVLACLGGAVFLCGYLASGRSRVRLRWHGAGLQWALLHDILRVGALACLSPVQTVLTILVLTWLVSQLGTTALAGFGIGTRLEFLLVPMAFAVGVASVPLVGMAVGAGQPARARRVAWVAAAVALAGLGLLGLLLALAPDLWSALFTADSAVLAAAGTYFHWVGPAYGFFGAGLSLYFSSLAAGHAGGPVLAGSLRLLVVAAGGALLASMASVEPWALFALAGAGMVVYGVSMALMVHNTPWATARRR